MLALKTFAFLMSQVPHYQWKPDHKPGLQLSQSHKTYVEHVYFVVFAHHKKIIKSNEKKKQSGNCAGLRKLVSVFICSKQGL